MEEQKIVEMVKNFDNLLFAESDGDSNKVFILLSEYLEEKAEELYESKAACDVCLSGLEDYIDTGKPKNMINYYAPKIGEEATALVRGYLCSRFGEDFKSNNISDGDAGDVARILMTDLKKVMNDCKKYVDEFSKNNVVD